MVRRRVKGGSKKLVRLVDKLTCFYEFCSFFLVRALVYPVRTLLVKIVNPTSGILFKNKIKSESVKSL